MPSLSADSHELKSYIRLLGTNNLGNNLRKDNDEHSGNNIDEKNSLPILQFQIESDSVEHQYIDGIANGVTCNCYRR